jgi:hypothetical protein
VAIDLDDGAFAVFQGLGPDQDVGLLLEKLFRWGRLQWKIPALMAPTPQAHPFTMRA